MRTSAILAFVAAAVGANARVLPDHALWDDAPVSDDGAQPVAAVAEADFDLAKVTTVPQANETAKVAACEECTPFLGRLLNIAHDAITPNETHVDDNVAKVNKHNRALCDHLKDWHHARACRDVAEMYGLENVHVFATQAPDLLCETLTACGNYDVDGKAVEVSLLQVASGDMLVEDDAGVRKLHPLIATTPQSTSPLRTKHDVDMQNELIDDATDLLVQAGAGTTDEILERLATSVLGGSDASDMTHGSAAAVHRLRETGMTNLLGGTGGILAGGGVPGMGGPPGSPQQMQAMAMQQAQQAAQAQAAASAESSSMQQQQMLAGEKERETEMGQMDSMLEGQVKNKLLAAEERHRTLESGLKSVLESERHSRPGQCDCCEACLPA